MKTFLAFWRRERTAPFERHLGQNGVALHPAQALGKNPPCAGYRTRASLNARSAIAASLALGGSLLSAEPCAIANRRSGSGQAARSRAAAATEIRRGGDSSLEVRSARRRD